MSKSAYKPGNLTKFHDGWFKNTFSSWINRREKEKKMVRPSLPYMALARNNPEENHKIVEAELARYRKFQEEAKEKGMDLQPCLEGYRFLHKTDKSQNYFMPSGMMSGATIAKDLLPIEPLPPGAAPTYDRDIDVVAMVVPEIEIETVAPDAIETRKKRRFDVIDRAVKKAREEMKETGIGIEDDCSREDVDNFAAQFLSHEDPYNPFSSNYNGEPVGPDSFGGTDEGSHYMSNSAVAEEEGWHDCTTVEQMRKDMQERLSPKAKEQASDYIKEVLQEHVQPISSWLGMQEEVKKEMIEEEDNKRQMSRDAIQAAIARKEEEAVEKIDLNSLRGLDELGYTKPHNMWDRMNEQIAREIGQQILGELLRNPNDWIQLYSGRKFFPMDPRVEDIDIEDIAHALSNMCRFTGHCKSFYSVAQHSVLVSHLSGTHGLWGLLHDASEAYVCDIARPVKRLDVLKGYRDVENMIQSVICQKFGLQPNEPSIVKEADTKMLFTEARDLMAPLHPDWVQGAKPLPFKIEALPPAEAKELFLSRYRELTGVSEK